MKLRHLNLHEINFKFKNKNFTYDEKNNFIEFQLENCIRYFDINITDKDIERQKYFVQIKRQIVKNELRRFNQLPKEEQE